MASLTLAIGFSALVTAQEDNSREQMIDMVLQIQQLQDEVRSLRGQIEEQAHLIDTLRQRQRDQYLKVLLFDRRNIPLLRSRKEQLQLPMRQESIFF